jgi:nitrate/nitrite-specific signal transduction histidine kinase
MLIVPIRDLQRATQRLAAGQLDQRATVSSSTELDQLATDVNHRGSTLTYTPPGGMVRSPQGQMNRSVG